MTIDGKLYHVSKNGYAIDRYAKGLHEIDGGMYYVKEDGSFLTNSAVEYLTFDANGRYTSGNATLDSYVDQALAACANSGMTKAQKLRAAYLYVRDHGAYLARPHQARGTTAWAEESALFMFEHKKGNCYCFAGQFLYMARRLGYNAYVVSGGVGRKDSDHAWVMICENGVPYIYDVELEWGYRAGRYGHAEYNMFAHRAGMPLSLARAGSKKSLARRSQSAVLCLQALSYAGVLALLLVDILHLSAASYVPFIYFQF